ncbi:PREDICTED: programmed cell death protein 2 isoform X1 [Ipomoea nil]|uniref:programmed cell death protein 2 isoform X1 n=1 Tax=Ipomoea nil TaxID=35883 RepID=UPI00090112D2|nr:PREDICTED: programmed cell death protein 2 isoform X1 [Ipomoea nil]
MSEDLNAGTSGDAYEKLKGLHLSSLDDEEDEDEVLIDDNVHDDLYDDEDDEDKVPVSLGFVEKKRNSWSLLRQLFPSKAGATPAWLDPINLPSGRSCLCDFCGEPLQFMLQVYAPLTEKDSTFHRTVFVFMCPSMSCLLKDQHEQWKRHPGATLRSVKVFRCQMPRLNSFYSSEPPKNDGTDKPSGDGAALCSWCGTWRGDKVCSGCKTVRYCSEKHQAAHWQSGHKKNCFSNISLNESNSNGTAARMLKGKFNLQTVASKSLWPEYEISNEDECDEVSDDHTHSTSLVSASQADETYNSLLDSFEGDDDKKSWASFQERISRAPDQVLRYCRYAKAKPLLPVSSGQPSNSDIPKCSYCGGPRAFEFQILPQLLYYFNVGNDVNSLDWATVVVYTCEASCEGSMAYKEEFAWVQVASQSNA